MRASVAILAWVVAVNAHAGSRLPPAVACQSAKLWVAAHHVERRTRCESATCAVRSTAKMRRSFTKLERSLPCLTRDDAGSVDASAHRFKARLAAMLRRRTRACVPLFVTATARLAAAWIDADRPTDWPPTEDRHEDANTTAWDAFDREREAAKALKGCRSVLLGPKLHRPAGTVERETAAALLPPAAATGITFVLPPAWRVHDAWPGYAYFATLGGYGHGGFMPHEAAVLTVSATQDVSLDAWLAGVRQYVTVKQVQQTTVDGTPASRAMTTGGEERSLHVFVERDRIALRLVFSWNAGAANEVAHLEDFDRILASARLVR
ncbi:MAG: hypothetical protein ACREQL_09830 [Candidatus Binatia bacterium]